jgi:galactonate dehydratase
MKITSITAYAIKAGVRYQPAGQQVPTGQLPGSDYLRLAPHPQLYSQRSEAVVVRVDTDDGITGWGECQAPVAPEVVQAIIERVIGPAVLGQDPAATSVRFEDMFGTMRVRGQNGGYQLDAIAGVDIALWDIRGKAAGLSISELIGGRFTDELPCYVTGLRGKTAEERQDEAARWAAEGVGVKPCLGFGLAEDVAELERIRAAVGDDGRLMVDALWSYPVPEAIRLTRTLARLGIELFEAPLAPEDVAGHARLVAAGDVAIAVGESLRTRHAFLPWLQAAALDIAQPDVMRNGISETIKIAALAETFNIGVALHTGCLTVIGMAATWQTAAALPGTLVQEFQPVMLETFNPWLTEPLELWAGRLVVPAGPGLGITLDEHRLSLDAHSVITVGHTEPVEEG